MVWSVYACRDIARHAHVIDLADACAVVAVVDEVLGHGWSIAEVGREPPRGAI